MVLHFCCSHNPSMTFPPVSSVNHPLDLIPLDFAMLIQKSELERVQKSNRLEQLLTETGKAQQETADMQKWAANIRKYLSLEELDRDIVDELIDHIEIGERTVVNGQRHQDIKIYYRFVGLV